VRACIPRGFSENSSAERNTAAPEFPRQPRNRYFSGSSRTRFDAVTKLRHRVTKPSREQCYGTAAKPTPAKQRKRLGRIGQPVERLRRTKRPAQPVPDRQYELLIEELTRQRDEARRKLALARAPPVSLSAGAILRAQIGQLLPGPSSPRECVICSERPPSWRMSSVCTEHIDELFQVRYPTGRSTR
jgi:hypothetical protein